MASYKEESISEEEKPKLENIDYNNDSDKQSLTDDEQVAQLAEKYNVNHRKLMWKIDLCVIPPVCLLYLLSFLDRTNVSNAKIYGLEKDLNLKGDQFNTALTVFFVPYVVFEIISNYLLKKFKPHVWLSFCIFCFGIITIGVGFVKNFGGFVACRILLGVFESGTFPGIFYLLGTYYRRTEAQRRYSFFFSSTCLAGGFGGLIAYGVNHLDGKLGRAGWRYIFIIEGAITAFCGILLFFLIADFPEEAKFLKDNERQFLKEKLALEAGDSEFDTKFTFKEIASCFKDPLIWFPALAYFGLIIPAYSYAYFAPTIIKAFGHSTVQTQLLSVYPWIVAFGFSLIVAVIVDYTNLRWPFVLFTSVLAIIGFAMVYGVKDNTNVRYGGCFMVVMGLYTAMPVLVCWCSMNFSGHLRKSVGTAWQVGFGNIGGIISSFAFLAKDSPKYKSGFSICFSFVAFAMVLSSIYFATIRNENVKKFGSGRITYATEFEEKDERAKQLIGDRHPNFKYGY